MTLSLELVAVAALVLLNGFFVGAEYSLVTVRRTRMEELRQEGNRRAKLVLALTARAGHGSSPRCSSASPSPRWQSVLWASTRS